MSEPLIDIVPVSGDPGAPRWRAVTHRGATVGVASLRPIIPFGPETAELTVYVDPAWRRRGIGSRLLAAVREQMAARGLVADARAGQPGEEQAAALRLVGDVAVGLLGGVQGVALRLVGDVAAGSPGEAFCQRHGFRHAGSRRHHLLTYCDVHRAWLGELVDAEHAGYRLTYWTGYLPDARRVEELLRSPSRPGNALLTAADAGGHLAAYAVAVVGARARARQWGPTVLPEHRSRRLGRWVNAALVQRLREVHPHVDEIETAGAEDDLHLLAVHQNLGFRPLRRTQLYEDSRSN